MVRTVAEPLHRARAIRVHCVGSDDGVIGGATLNDEAAQIGSIMKLKRAKAVKPHNADARGRNVCPIVIRIAGSQVLGVTAVPINASEACIGIVGSEVAARIYLWD